MFKASLKMDLVGKSIKSIYKKSLIGNYVAENIEKRVRCCYDDISIKILTASFQKLRLFTGTKQYFFSLEERKKG